ncbi:hypothetical protein [Streptomyces sp. HNM0574]|uniref:hypothetical protein n=1 Tax=Streptomyces sp. HNM0574 TaxID=2714954 RepID=UPI00146B3F4B|nr:hypothetical protein [Streptomyces sp. HNM0574]NLU68033.1 hypothetical protein [Streptomyces sp. HNM0574]
MNTTQKTGVSTKIKDAEGSLDTLRESLTRAGITLPSLQVDPSTWSSSTGPAMLDLGPCNTETAARLSALLRTAADRTETTPENR